MRNYAHSFLGIPLEKYDNTVEITLLVLYLFLGIVGKYVTCYGKIDHLQFFIKTEFLAWNDSPTYAESNGASFMK